jgi:hypothetical protein
VGTSELYLRIRRSGTTLYFEYGTGENGFVRIHSVTQPWAPAEVGLYINNKNGGEDITAYFDFFRYKNSNDDGPIGGVRTVYGN